MFQNDQLFVVYFWHLKTFRNVFFLQLRLWGCCLKLGCKWCEKPGGYQASTAGILILIKFFLLEDDWTNLPMVSKKVRL
jgi:hypothetical protein